MSQENVTPDTWQERYLAVVPAKLTPRDASVLLDLIEEDTNRFVESLTAFALPYDEIEVFCECSPDINPACPLGDHSQGHLVAAEWRISEVGDYDSFSYYCTPCKEAFAGHPGASEYRFEVVGDETHGGGEEGEDE